MFIIYDVREPKHSQNVKQLYVHLAPNKEFVIFCLINLFEMSVARSNDPLFGQRKVVCIFCGVHLLGQR